jgi:diaminopimelate epimerase
MAKVSFIKVESLGNDFVIVERARAGATWSSARAAKICDRRGGVGADGLILLGPVTRHGIRFRLFNADGSTAEWSGNGVRGVGSYLAAMNPRQREFHLDTAIGCIRIDTRRRERGGVLVGFSRPMPSVATISAHQARQVAAMAGRYLLAGPVYVDAGNPHSVFVVSGFDYDWQRIGAECQALNRRTGGINVEFARVVSSRHIELRIYERGVGPTPSSGSGALAAVAACFAMDFVGNKLKVSSPGGAQTAVISADADSVALEAPARIVMAGVWSDGDVLPAGRRR